MKFQTQKHGTYTGPYTNMAGSPPGKITQNTYNRVWLTCNLFQRDVSFSSVKEVSTTKLLYKPLDLFVDHLEMERLLIIDISPFCGGNAEEQKTVADKWNKAFKQLGFAIITGHGVPDNIIENLYSDVVKFFEESKTTKMKYCLNRGYGDEVMFLFAKKLLGEHYQ